MGNTNEVTRLISEGVSVNAVDDKGNPPLHLAAEKGHKEIVKILLDKGTNVNAKDVDGKPPFGLATNEEIKALL
uniref:ankyrin repeat domain-containing protein n=1 Tax=Wolbachia endosymbiont of Nilaparvata lugens TaxID=357143 RepID=UPI00117F95B2